MGFEEKTEPSPRGEEKHLRLSKCVSEKCFGLKTSFLGSVFHVCNDDNVNFAQKHVKL